MHHRIWACLDANPDLAFLIGFCDANVAAKPVDNLVNYSGICNKVDILRPVGIHIRHGRRQLLVIDAVLIARYAAERCGLFICNGHIGDPI